VQQTRSELVSNDSKPNCDRWESTPVLDFALTSQKAKTVGGQSRLLHDL
jgi:hypothetical protein